MATQAPDDQGWFAGTRAGRAVLGVALAFLSISLVIWNLPPSTTRDDLRPTIRPIVNALAIDQSWTVFAPDPNTTSIAVVADVTLADGSIDRYEFPGGDDLIGAYREYRWRKWERRVRLDSNRRLWRPTAEWIADRYDEPVRRVALIRYFSETPEPGSDVERVWDSFEFFVLEVDETGDTEPAPADAESSASAEADEPVDGAGE